LLLSLATSRVHGVITSVQITWVGGTKLASLSSCCASASRIGKTDAAVAASDPATKVRRLVVTVSSLDMSPFFIEEDVSA